MCRMRNWKVKNKLLFGFGILIVLMVAMSLLAGLGLKSIHDENNSLVHRVIPNTERVWELRRNLMSEQRYELMAFAESNPSVVHQHLTAAQKDMERNTVLIEEYKANCRIDPEKITRLETCFNKQERPRSQVLSLLAEGTPESDAAAYEIMESEFMPLLDEEATILAEIGADQNAISQQQAEQELHTYRLLLLLLFGLLIIALVVSLLVMRKLVVAITAPLAEIKNATYSLSQGDFDAHISYESRDEFGDTCQSMQDSFSKLKDIIAEISRVLGCLSDGDLAAEPNTHFPGEMEKIEQSLLKFIHNINDTMSAIARSSGQIDAGASQVSDGAQALAQGATEQASSVEELSATLSDVSVQVQANSENAQKANDLASASGEMAISTEESMNEMVQAMREISGNAQDIKKVIKVIDDIAFQTNILALNAAVEAARAGSAGKGFAVVADEVRNLAAKSAEAAKNTTVLIENAIQAVTHGEQIADKTSVIFEDLASKVQQVVETIQHISNASAQQASAIQEINTGVDQISAVVQTNSATSEESAAASQELSSQAGVLNRLVQQFQLADSQGDQYQAPMQPIHVSTVAEPSWGGAVGR